MKTTKHIDRFHTCPKCSAKRDKIHSIDDLCLLCRARLQCRDNSRKLAELCQSSNRDELDAPTP